MRTETRHPMRALRPVLLASLIGLTGCFSLGRTEPAQRHYVLGGERVQQTVQAPSDLAGLTVGVRRLRLAPYLEAPFLVIRQGSNEVAYSEFHRWGEPLGGGVNRTVATHLAARPSFRAVDVAPWPARERYDYLVQLHVERFEGLAADSVAGLEGEVHMLVSWEILRQGDGAVLARGTTDHREGGWKVGDYAGLVRSLDAGLNALSNDLATTLAGLGAPLAERR